MAFVFETIMDQTISSNIAAKQLNLQGYEDYALLGRFEGPAGATVKMEINNNGLLVATENITLSSAGWFNLSKKYPVFSPMVSAVFYNPSAPIKVRMTAYAAGAQ